MQMDGKKQQLSEIMVISFKKELKYADAMIHFVHLRIVLISSRKATTQK